MNRIINDPGTVVEDMLRGILAAHPNLEAVAGNPRVIKRVRAPIAGKVGIVIGGASGHEPAFSGYLGDALADAVAIGEVFSSPTAMSFFDAMRVADGGRGVACLYGNHAGDSMNVAMAIKMAERAGICVETAVANDDVSSAPGGEEDKRRGAAGQVLMWKTAAASAERGDSLDEVIRIARKTIARTRSICIGLSACIIPAVGKANFRIDEGRMEIGIGHRGEPGIRGMEVASADEMARIMVDAVVSELPASRGHRMAVLITGLGATPLMEQYILYASIQRHLGEAGFEVVSALVGNAFTSLDMMGASLSVLQLDDELEALVRLPCASIPLTHKGKTP